MLLAACTGAPAPAPAAGPSDPAGPPKTNKLVMFLNPPPNEFNDIRRVCCFDITAMRPMYESLVGIDRATGKYTPKLATEWNLEPDGKSFRFKLQKGVQFNRGHGEFTAKDVDWSWHHQTDDLSKSPPNIFAPWWKNTILRIETVNDYEVVYHIKPDSTFMDMISESSDQMPIRSKAQFDKEGDAGDNPAKPVAGTGPYDFKDRQIGSYIRYERAAGKHWRVTPDFPELELRWSREASVRLAALLAGEAHITTLPDDLMPQAERSGMKIAAGKIPGTRSWGTWVCCARTEDGKYYRDNSSPLLNVKVRQALNKAIDRDSLQKAFFKRSERMYINHMHPTWLGWDNKWERQWGELYGYDVEAAKKLLAEAGYTAANPLETNIAIRSSTVIPGAPDVADAIASMWRAAGVKVNMIQSDTPTQTAELRAFKWTNHMYIDASATVQVFAWPNRNSDLFNFPRQQAASWFDADTNRINEQLMGELNEPKQAVIMRELGDMMYNRFGSVPLFFVPVEAVVNPQFVADYTFPGPLYGAWTHLEYIKAVR